jgi:hypothetical protein
VEGTRNRAGVQVGIGGFRALLAPMLARVGLGRLLGLSYGGARDLYAVFGYNRALTFEDYANRFARQDIARTIVSLPAISTWKQPPDVTDSQGLDGAFAKAWAALNKRIGLTASLMQADRLSGIGNYGGLFIGYAGSRRLDLPVEAFPAPADMSDPSVPPQIAYLVPLSQGSFYIDKIESSFSNPRFGYPTQYKLKTNATNNSLITTAPLAPIPTPATTDQEVHYTRIFHLAEDTAESPIIGTPRLQPVFNRLDDYEKVTGGAAETYWLNARKGLHADVDSEMALAPDDEKQLSDEIEEYEHQLRRVIRTKGVTLKDLGTSVADPSKAFDVCVTAIAAATRIPKRMLLGSELGELASEQDRANWGEVVQARQINYAEPKILRPMIDQLVALRILPAPQGAVDVKWPPPITMNVFDLARTAGHIARAAESISNQRKNGVYVISPQEFRERVLGYAHEDAQLVQYFTPVSTSSAGQGKDGSGSGSGSGSGTDGNTSSDGGQQQ